MDNIKNPQSNTPDQNQEPASQKDDSGFLEFLKEPEAEEIKDYLTLSKSEMPSDREEKPFYEFIESKDVSVASVNNLFKSFLKKKGFFGRYVIGSYKNTVSWFDSIFDAMYLFYKKVLGEDIAGEYIANEKIDTGKYSSKESLEYACKLGIGPGAKVCREISEIKIEKKEIKKKQLKKRVIIKKDEKIQLKTLTLLSSRMFTAGSTRTILTILGISISIGVILFLISFGYGLQRVVLQRITTEESLLSIVVTLPEDISISYDQLEEVKKIQEVEHVSPLVGYNGYIEMESQIDSSIFIVDEQYFALAGLMSNKGEALGIEKNETIISSAAALLLGFGDNETGEIDVESAMGTSVILTPTFRADYGGGVIDLEDIEKLSDPQKKDFIIKDVIDDDLASFAYVLENEFDDISSDYYIEAKVKVVSNEKLDIVKEQLINQGYIVSSISDTVEETRKIFRGIQLVLGFFGLIALTISAIGMLNILTIVLLERTQEIGIMKAIGASSSDIWKIVMFDSIIIGFLGGVGGAIIGISTSKLFNLAFALLAKRIGGQPLEIFQIPPGFILTIIIFSGVIGFITGVWPAIRASRISPLEAIRYK